MAILHLPDGDIWQSKAGVLVCPVNTVGVMGKGLARDMAERLPSLRERYIAKCRANELGVGKPVLIRLDADHAILCFPTKLHWRFPSQLKWIDAGLQALVSHYREWGIESIAFPMIGCGNGGLDWRDVRRLLHKYLADTAMDVEVYGP